MGVMLAAGIQRADLVDHALAHDVVGQAAEGLGADDVAVAALHQLDHLGGQQPALAHLGTQRDDALGLLHQLLEGAGGVEAGVASALSMARSMLVQPVQELVDAHLHGQLAAVQDVGPRPC